VNDNLDFKQIILEQRKAVDNTLWTGTMIEYLGLVKDNPGIACTAPERIYNMIMAYGTEALPDTCKTLGYEDIVRYKFFDNRIYGTYEPVHDIMRFLKAAARRTETGKRILILVGPVSSGKSTLASLIKKGLEADKTPKYVIKGCPLHEEPLHLIPNADRPKWQEMLGLKIEGHLCPQCLFTVENEYKGMDGHIRWEDVPVEQVRFSEQKRLGIGTFQPADPKSQDVSELIGRVNLAKISRFGETDPRAYQFDGELEVGNGGILESIELLKCVTGDTLVVTENGVFCIADITGNTKVYDGSNTVESITTVDQGEKEIMELVTGKGYRLKGSKDHRIQVVRFGKLDWVALQDIRSDDFIPIQRLDNYDSETFVEYPEKLLHYQRSNHRSHNQDYVYRKNVDMDEAVRLYKSGMTMKEVAKAVGCSVGRLYNRDIMSLLGDSVRLPRVVRLPKYVDEDMGRLMGYLISEGSFHGNGFSIANMDRDIRNDVKRLTENMGLRYACDKTNSYLTSTHLKKIIMWLGFDFHHASEKVIPWSILRSPKKVVASFLSAYFTGDGTVTCDRVGCCSASQELTHQIQFMLLKFGIICKISKVYNKEYDRYYYHLNITGADVVLFRKHIGFTCRVKQSKLDKISDEIQYQERSYKHVFPLYGNMEEAYRRAVKSGFTIKYNLCDVDKGSFRNAISNGHVSYNLAENVIRSLENFTDVTELWDLYSLDYFYDTVESITSLPKERVYDLVINSDRHAYCGNGFINHNCDTKLLYVFITVAQEQVIKTPGFPHIYVDELILSHTNSNEFDSFKADKKNEALHDRMYPIQVPWNVVVNDEIKIYEKMIRESDFKGIHIAPHTLRIAAQFAVLTRLTPSTKVPSLLEKMRIYNGEVTEEMRKAELDVKTLRQEGRAAGEGMTGISPRFIINALNVALGMKEDKKCVNPIDIIRSLRENFSHQIGITDELQKKYIEIMLLGEKDSVAYEYKQIAKKEVNMAFLVAYEEQAQSLFENYVMNAKAFCKNEKVLDSILGEYSDPDEKLMRSIEEIIGVPINSRKEFRNNIFVYKSTLLEQGRPFTFNDYAPLKEAIEKKLISDLKNVVSLTIADKTAVANEKSKKRRTDALAKLAEHGYCDQCGEQLLSFVGELLRKTD